jgi:hypothetical protein
LWRDVWTTNDTKRSERHERVSCFSWPFACFVVQSTDAEVDALVYGLTEEEITIVEGRLDHE